MLAQNVTKVLNGQNLDKVLRDKIWWLSQLSHIYALLSEADLSIKADTWITSCANLLPSPKTLTSKPTKCYEPVKLKCFPHKRKKYILWIQYIHFAIHINTFWNLNNTTQQLNSTPHFRAQTRIEINARKSVILKCFTQQEAQCRQCVWIILVFPWLAVRVDSKIFLLTSEGILCVFHHKYRKAIQHEARPDQSGASIFGVEILGLHFQTLSLILLLIGPAFPGTDMDPIRRQVNTPVWFNRRTTQ